MPKLGQYQPLSFFVKTFCEKTKLILGNLNEIGGGRVFLPAFYILPQKKVMSTMNLLSEIKDAPYV